PNLWGCIVGRPGAMKSPAIAEALKPLHRLEAKAREQHEADCLLYEAHCHEWELRKQAREASFRQALKKNPNAALDGDFSPNEPAAPVERRYVTNDTSYEKLGEILAANPNGVLAHRDELVSLLKALDQEQNCGARGFFLTAWSGKEGYTFDRIGRG